MIDKLIEDYIKSQLEPLKTEILQMKEKLEKLKQQKTKTQDDYNKTSDKLDLAISSNKGIKGLLNRIFRRKVYNQISELGSESFTLFNTNNAIQAEIEKLEADLNKKVEEYKESKKNIESQNLQEDKKTAIELLIKKDPKLAESLEFIKEAIGIDITSIRFDKTNDPELYKQYSYKLREFYIKEVAKKKGRNSKELAEEYDGNPYIDTYAMRYHVLGKIIEELEKPKVPEEGKYKIPHKYLYEAFRDLAERSIRDQQSIDIDRLTGGDNGQISTLSDYLKTDCQMSFKVGEEFEKFFEIYRRKGYDILQHKFSIEASGGKEKRNLAYSIGKRESLFGGHERHNAEYTFTGTFNKSATFIDLLHPHLHKIIALVPKEAFKEKSTVPVWGSDTREGEAFLLPEYIFGIMEPSGKIEKNPVPVEERKKYRFLFKNKSFEPIVNQKVIENHDER